MKHHFNGLNLTPVLPLIEERVKQLRKEAGEDRKRRHHRSASQRDRVILHLNQVKERIEGAR